jgi:hypothetical protein
MALEINIINQIISKRIKYGRKEGGGREGRMREGRMREKGGEKRALGWKTAIIIDVWVFFKE